MPARLATVLAAFALVTALLALVVALRTSPAPEAEEAEGDAETAEELAHLMAYIQRYTEKLYLAGENGNAALAQFYVHELEETFEEVEAGGYVEDGNALDALVASLVPPALERVEEAVEAQALGAAGPAAADFGEAYARLVAACNSCHETTGHGFVRIVAPAAGSFPSQDFRPAGD
ncbi:MAG: hypothetical protein R3181_12900 [Rubricoccaceae bacterium]|nr:hypothetical protein [Rubricoccaceae bacterium]